MTAIEKELFFTREEYAARLATLRGHMEAAGLEVLLVASPENIYYVTGHQTFGFHTLQLAVVSLERDPFLVTRYLESFNADRYAWITDIVRWDDVVDPVTATVEALRERGLAGKRTGCEEKAFFLQVASWKKLAAAIDGLADGSGLVERGRTIKSPQEIAYMREAARLTDLGFAAGIEEIAAGRTENDVAAAAFDAMTRAGAEYLTRDPIVTSGDRAGIPHTSYYRRVIQPGDTVLLEYSGVYHRHYAPLMRSALVGGPDAEIERMAAVAIEALNAGIEAVRPGATVGAVDTACRAVVDRAGLWENYRKRAGYAVGIGFSSWMEQAIASLRSDDTTEQRPGMCFHIPIAFRIYGKAAVGFSETVTVTETGCEVLGRTPRELARR